MARGRTVKYPPKRGNLKRSEVKRVVEKVGRRGGGTTRSSTVQTHYMKVGRDAKTGRFIPCKEAERRKETAVVETIKRPRKKK